MEGGFGAAEDAAEKLWPACPFSEGRLSGSHLFRLTSHCECRRKVERLRCFTNAGSRHVVCGKVLCDVVSRNRGLLL